MPSERAAVSTGHRDVASHADDRAGPNFFNSSSADSRKPSEASRARRAARQRACRRTRRLPRARAGSPPRDELRLQALRRSDEHHLAAVLRARISWASASPGHDVPSVPPAAMTKKRRVSAHASSRVRSTSCCDTFRIRPAGDPAGDERRAAVGDERQRDPLRGHERENDRQFIAAWTTSIAVAPAARNPANASGARLAARRPRQATMPKQRRAGRSDEAELLAHDREDEVGVRKRQEEELLPARRRARCRTSLRRPPRSATGSPGNPSPSGSASGLRNARSRARR